MAQTPDSSSASYLSAEEFLKRADPRVVGDLVSQDDGRVDASALLDDPALAAALLDASGDVEAACFRGGRYAPADLAALTGAGQARLYRLVRDLTMLKLYELRGQELPQRYAAVAKELELLADGERIFPFAESEAAGRMNAQRKDTASEVTNRNLLTERAKRFFGARPEQRGG